ncbi:MAG: twin-arginine translocation signal domain-containing protein, partial [Candidatus Eremiobacteraeota bacterium]|nr:twin-arginine translocation signal domain-containing protein [Candidatus Eremiobacteraeota bacterium]
MKGPQSRRDFVKVTTVAATAAITGFPAFIPQRGEAAETLLLGVNE